MSRPVPGPEVSEIIHGTFGDGCVIDDEDYPLSEISRITVEIEGEQERFFVASHSRHAVVNILHRTLTARYETLSIIVLCEWDSIDGENFVSSWGCSTIRNQKRLPGQEETRNSESRKNHPSSYGREPNDPDRFL